MPVCLPTAELNSLRSFQASMLFKANSTRVLLYHSEQKVKSSNGGTVPFSLSLQGRGGCAGSLFDIV